MLERGWSGRGDCICLSQVVTLDTNAHHSHRTLTPVCTSGLTDESRDYYTPVVVDADAS